MSTSLARRFKCDVSADGITWLPFNGMNDFSPQENPNYQSTAAYDTDGYDSFEKTLTAWQITVKAFRRLNAGVFDPGQELVRKAQFTFGEAARLYVRWYDKDGAPEAKSGRALIEWNQSKTGVSDVEEVTATFKGDGVLKDIENPAKTPAVPAIASATPPGAVQGGQVTIQGANFNAITATTGVKFGTVNAASWTVVSPSLIVAVVPAGTAGAAPIVITNANGPSDPFPYTRGA